MRILIILLLSITLIEASTKCANFIGRLVCPDKTKMNTTVVQLWDKDCDYDILCRFNSDDLASTFFVTNDDEGYFSITGCASDSNFLWMDNSPEFFLRILHSCRGYFEEEDYYPINMQKFSPYTNDHFDLNPIRLG